MRPFIISALAATLIGCTWVAPKQPRQASLMSYGTATAPKTVAKSKRATVAKKTGRRHHRKAITSLNIAKSDSVSNVSLSVQPKDKSNNLSNAKLAKPETAQSSQPDTTSNASSDANSSVSTKTETAQSFQHAQTSNLSINPNSTAMAKTEIPQSSQRDENVIKKAMPIIAAKMENTVSVEIVEMKRAEKTAAGKSIDTICGYVRGKTASGAETGARPFLYLVQENEAYVGGYNMAISPYHNLCRQ